MIYHISRITQHFCLTMLIVLALGMTAIRLFLWGVEDYKTDLARKISELTSIPIEVGELNANMRGFSPEVILEDIRVLAVDEQGKPSIKLEQVRVGIDLMQLFFSHEILSSSWLTLVGVELSVIRQANGQISIVGLNSNESKQPYWLLEGRKYEVLKSQITWLDEKNKKPSIRFDDVDLLIKNDRDTQIHEVHLVSDLPEHYGSKMRLSLSVKGNVFESNNLNGLLYVEGDDVQITEILQTEMSSDFSLSEASGDFKIWSQWHKSQLTHLSGIFDGQGLIINKQQQRYSVDHLDTAFSLARQKQQWLVDFDKLSLTSNEKQWPIAQFSISADLENKLFAGIIKQLDIAQISDVINFVVPKTREDVQQSISKLEAKGLLKDFSFYYDQINIRYGLQGAFQQVSFKAGTDFPQLENFSGYINGSDQSGQLKLSTLSGSLFFPQSFKHAFSVDKLQGIVAWRQLEDKWQISTDELVFDSMGFKTQSVIRAAIPKNDESIFLDLRTSLLNHQDISQVKQYYPSTITSEGVVSWLDNAFKSGKIKQGDVLIYGELDEMPFLDGQGVLDVVLDIEDVELNFAEGWPHLQKLNAQVSFIKESLAVDIAHADVGDFFVKQAMVEIPSFEKSPYLLVNGQAGGGILPGLKFMQKTPVHDLVDGFMEVLSPLGNTTIDLDMKIPLIDDIPEIVDGVAHFKQAGLNVKAIDLSFKELSGRLNFTQDGLFGKNIQAKTLGYPVIVNVENGKENTAITIDGKTDVSQLSQQFDFLQTELFEKKFKGSTEYQVLLDLPDNENNPAMLELVADLKGMSIDLPEQLKKIADQKKLLTLNMLFNQQEMLPLELNYADQLSASFNIDKQHQTLYSGQVAYGKFKSKLSAEKGLAFVVKQKDYDLSQWMPIIKGGADQKNQAESKIAKVNIVAKNLLWNNKSYGAFEIAMHKQADKWQGNLFCSVAKGAFNLPFDNKNQKISLDLRFLNLSRLLALDFNGLGSSQADMPLITINSEQLWWKNDNLGKLSLDTASHSEGVRIKQFNIKSNFHELNMTADWIRDSTVGHTHVQGTLEAADIGVSLSMFDIDSDLTEATAKAGFYGDWQGTPYQFGLKNVKGRVDVDMEGGRISSIEPGFGRILGLIAFDQWLKRLALDFGDVYKQGLSLKKISGSFDILAGKAMTDNLLIDSVPAKINISGEADLLAQTLDHSVRVVPKSSDALPIAGTIVSTVAGTITQFLTKDYKDGYFFGSKYKISGSWDAAEVTALRKQDGIFKKTWTGLTDFSWVKPK